MFEEGEGAEEEEKGGGGGVEEVDEKVGVAERPRRCSPSCPRR